MANVFQKGMIQLCPGSNKDLAGNIHSHSLSNHCSATGPSADFSLALSLADGMESWQESFDSWRIIKKWKTEIHKAVGSFKSMPSALRIKSNQDNFKNSRVILKGTADSMLYVFHLCLIKILDLPASSASLEGLKAEKWRQEL